MLHNSVNTLSSGLVKDTSPLTQKEGTYTYALNAVLESTTGDYPFITNEIGNTQSIILPGTNPILLGKVLTDTETFICCVVDDTTSYIIEYFPRSNSFTTIIENVDLNFDSRYPVKMLFRIRKGCERTIYFTDNFNPYRVMDIDNLAQYGDPFEAARLNLFRTLTLPQFSAVGVQDYGGDLPLGNYQFAIQYLDKDLNETPWIDFTPFLPIVDENLSSAYHEIDGGYNIDDVTVDVIGGVPNSTKSIELQVSNLDSDFAFFRVAVIMATAGTGEVSAVHLLTPQPITSDTYNWIFRGVNPNNSTPTTLAEVQAGVLKINKVGSHAQIDNRLILANLTNEQFDWAAVQRAANILPIEWTGKSISKEDIENSGSAKSPDYYLHSKSFLRDEVYAFGIYGIMDDGTTTPVFHIPGREAVTGDDDEITVVNTPPGVNEIPLADVRHLGFDDVLDDIGYGPGKLPRWLLYNTSTVDGLMSFWESDVEYPNEVDCDGVPIYPYTDLGGGNYEMHKIRHHKFPDNRITPFEDTDNIYPIGIKPDMTPFLAAIPTELALRVLDWRICMAKRTDNDRTVLDKGYLTTARIAEGDGIDGDVTLYLEDDRYNDFTFNTPLAWTMLHDKKIHYFFSPKQMLERPLYNSDYVTTEMQLEVPFNALSFVQRWFIDTSIHLSNTTLYNRITEDYRHIDRYKQLDGLEFTGPNPDFGSYPWVNSVLGVERVTNSSFTTPVCTLLYDDDYEWQMATTSSPPKFSYVSIKKYNRSINTALHNLQYLDIVKETVPFDHYFGGDIFISYMTHKVTSSGETYSALSAYYETELNPELRHAGLVEPIVQEYFKEKVSYTTNQQLLVKYAQGYYPQEDKYYARPEFLAFNKDYIKHSDVRALFSLPFNYNWCSDCGDQYPYRIVASEKSFQSEVSDRYRTFLANNFVDLNGDCGGIEDLVISNDNLIALTYNYPVFIPTKPQSLQTNETLTYVGTGEIFSIPPRKMSTTNYPHGGCRDWMGVITTEFGTFYADSEHGKVHTLGNPPNNISAGLNNWLETNLPFNVDTQWYELFGKRYPWRYPTNGIGIVSTYDPRHKRFIITKNDYTVNNTGTFGGEASIDDPAPLNNILYFDPGQGVFFISNDGVVNQIVPFSNGLYFKNHSWTLSYSPQHQAWVSYHSYLPYNYLNDGNTFYSLKQYLGRIYEHNRGSYQRYYNEAKKEHVLEFIINKDPQLVKTFGSMELVCQSTLDGVDSNIIFDKAWFYNSNQSTGFKTLKLKTNPYDLDYNQNQILIDKVQRNWKFNNLRDIATAGVPLSTSNWATILGDYFTDKVPINTISNPNLFTQVSRFRDRWLACRLSFKPSTNHKLTTNILNTQQNISFR